jgi:hypothetical protein
MRRVRQNVDPRTSSSARRSRCGDGGRMQTKVAAEMGIIPTILRRWQLKLGNSSAPTVSSAAKPPVSAMTSPSVSGIGDRAAKQGMDRHDDELRRLTRPSSFGRRSIGLA